ncbi:MAG: lipoprotein signal peptidase [Bacteroidetes bacterium]|nr:lipoprotein signal peptidase [Bacteroidota bacterium]
MKGKHVILLILGILIADQVLKIWVKTHLYYHEERLILGTWFRLYFIENEGMAYGWKLGGQWGKIFLTLFRLFAVIAGSWYMKRILSQQYHKGFIICASLIYAGAAGNLIDSLFYGVIFSASEIGGPLAVMFPEQGYAAFLHGHVVDMLYFPLIENYTLPNWIPFMGGELFTFFQPIFNIADASISTGIITLLVFQKRFLKTKENESVENADYSSK